MILARIERADVEKTAQMLRLDVDEAEVDALHQAMSEVLTYAAMMDEVDTDGVEPTTHGAPPEALRALRPDEVRPSLPKEKVLANAPQVQDGHFRVPRILDEE